MENILLHKQQHISQTCRDRREQKELLYHWRTLFLGREHNLSIWACLTLIPSCRDTTISCYRRQWYSLARRSIFPGTSLPAGFSGSLIFCAPDLQWNIHVFQINWERRKNWWPGTGEIWQELWGEIFLLPAGLYIHKHLSFPTVRNTFTKYSLITCTAWDKSDTKQCLSFSSLPIPCKTKSGT